MESGERVVGDLRLRGAHGGDQARLARRRVPDECNIRHRLQLEENIALKARGAEKRESGRFSLGRRERGVAEPALSALCHHKAKAGSIHVEELVALGVFYDGSDGNREQHLLAGGATLMVALARLTVVRPAVRRPVEAQQRGCIGVAHEDDVAAVATVATIGAGERLELLALDRDAAVATMPSAEMEGDLVDE